MTFTVEWMPPALKELADAWNRAADRNAVTSASNRVDQRLAADPLGEGESRGGVERITFEPPLRVLFRVFETSRRVEVYSVGVFGRRGGS